MFVKYVHKFVNEYKYMLAGIFYLFLEFFIFYLNQGVVHYDIFFWFCNHSAFLFAIAFFLKKFDFVKALICVGFISQAMWLIDLLFRLFFGFYIIGVTQYVFDIDSNIGVFYPIAVHILSTFVALFLTYKIKTKKIVLLYSGIYLLILYVLTLVFTLPYNDINCVYNACKIIVVNPFFWTPFWIFIVYVLLILPTYYLQVWLYEISKK